MQTVQELKAASRPDSAVELLFHVREQTEIPQVVIVEGNEPSVFTRLSAWCSALPQKWMDPPPKTLENARSLEA